MRNYLRLLAIFALAGITACVAKLSIEDRRDQAITEAMDATQSDLLRIGGQITGIKDGDFTTPDDFIAAYAQIEPLEREYDLKLDKFNKLYTGMRERDAHRSVLDLQRWRGTHHPKTWEQMSEIVSLVRQINDITKREISVVHAMASLPEFERARFWHEQFLPLAAQEKMLRNQLRVLGEGHPGAATQ